MMMIEASKNPPSIGDSVWVTDETGKRHAGLVTAYWAGDTPDSPLNCVYVSSDPEKTDPYGNQIERLSSVSHKSKTGNTPGRFWQ